MRVIACSLAATVLVLLAGHGCDTQQVSSVIAKSHAVVADGFPAGVWVHTDPQLDRTMMLELHSDGTGLLVRREGDRLRDSVVRWARDGSWIGMALSGGSAFKIEATNDALGLTPTGGPRLRSLGEETLFVRTHDAGHLRMLPSYGAPPEEPTVRESAIGVWAAGSGEASFVFNLRSDGTGAYAVATPGYGVGELFRWNRRGEKITLSGSDTPMDLAFRDNTLFVVQDQRDPVQLKRSKNPRHVRMVDLTPPQPKPPGQPALQSGQ